ncbi:telomerase Cajal body protein 1-like isoform X1 [Amphibalanus amphitrite]|nr:telomerase Cajal body protein 1-like isoform X1 [Amphibalanus amphitrite]XP_043198237.1 telomerase Cajal body protein 1-like isoform X1 [Amphibalanus amphitrite]XP_043198238.1 telomerase Cajal body protein 1-like isoform X1 [Amphibalanus amphitrite]XP_043198239.1 telomerase Cajal body protein 1-like isoform X1 [Amphibalanus amphitrite]XP_043198241.1 telomerase Cajal body protein 1-like isoform X1 [Amphibalanus amphitrite]
MDEPYPTDDLPAKDISVCDGSDGSILAAVNPTEPAKQEGLEPMAVDIITGNPVQSKMLMAANETSSQATGSAQNAGDPVCEPSDPVLEHPEPPTEAADLSLEAGEAVPEVTGDSTVSQQPEGMVTDRGSLSYTGEPQLLTTVTAPFSASNFTKGCKWSPDGTCLLVCSEDGCLRVLNLPESLYSSAATGAAPETPLPPPPVALQSREGELIYDYTWFPLMRSDDPATCCYASTSRAHPIHLFDAFDGGLRCSYRAYNSVDEVAAAYSVAFDPCGERLFAGLDGCVSVFDVNRPGRQMETRKMKDKQSLTSQPGLVSCIRFCAAAPDVYATGSYLRSIGLYGTEDGAPLCVLQGQTGGVTHLQFSQDGRRLYSGGRKDPEVLCWDLRNLGRILFSMQRNVTTNQRVYFDTDWSGRYLFSGDCDGCVQVWDTMEDPASDLSETLLLPSVRKFGAHRDCCNGISVHPWLPVLATSSGQRHLSDLLDSSDEEEEEEEEEDGDPPHRRQESSVKLWWVGD